MSMNSLRARARSLPRSLPGLRTAASRKSALAAATVCAITLTAGVAAVAALGDLPVLGFGSAHHAATAQTTPAEPVTVEEITYDDEVVQQVVVVAAADDPAAAVAADVATDTPSTRHSSGARPTSSPTTPATAGETVPTTRASRTRTVSVTEAPATRPAGATSTRSSAATRPPVPSGCLEPEWDAELGVWHCKGD
jgi:hypothetical protein